MRKGPKHFSNAELNYMEKGDKHKAPAPIVTNNTSTLDYIKQYTQILKEVQDGKHRSQYH